jgi:Zinc binding domain
MSVLRGEPATRPAGPAAAEPCCAAAAETPEAGADTAWEPSGPLPAAPLCPASRHPGQPVAWRTVAALAQGPLPPRQDFWLCGDPGCEVVYFGAAGARVTLPEMRVRPGFKRGGELLCYCFLILRADLEAEIAATGATTIPERIAARVKAGGCACEVRNPGGKCCLAEVRAQARDRQRVPRLATSGAAADLSRRR